MLYSYYQWEKFAEWGIRDLKQNEGKILRYLI